jgi:hypothetical protein
MSSTLAQFASQTETPHSWQSFKKENAVAEDLPRRMPIRTTVCDGIDDPVLNRDKQRR